MKAAKEFTQTLLRYGHYGILFTRRRINVSHTRSQLRNGVLGNLPRAVATLGMAPSEHLACARGGGVTSEVDKYRAGGRTDGWMDGGRHSLSLSASEVHSFLFLPPPFDADADGQLRQRLRHTFSPVVVAVVAAAASVTHEASLALALPLSEMQDFDNISEGLFGGTIYPVVLGT